MDYPGYNVKYLSVGNFWKIDLAVYKELSPNLES